MSSTYRQHIDIYRRRYVDDTFCLFNNEQDALVFFDFLNSQHPNIKFTMEKESNKMLAFLDVCISNKDPCNLLSQSIVKTLLLDFLLISIALPLILIKLVLSAP